MSNLIAVVVTLALFVVFPVFIFYLLVRAIRGQARWWGVVILLSILTCYCTTMVGVAGLIVGGNATESAALEQRYCEQFCEALTQTETLPEAIARMDAAATSDEYQVKEPSKNLRFRYVWLLGGCFLFAGANLMMFGPGRREKLHPADCIMMIVAALVVFLTGIWQIAWGNGYTAQASLHRRMLTGWHDGISPDEVPATNAEIVAKLGDDGVKTPGALRMLFLELSGRKDPRASGKNSGGDSPTAAPGGVAIIGGADGPTAVFIGSELLKRQGGALAESSNAEEKTEAPDAAD